MKYRILGKTGLKVSEIGFGGIPIQRVSFKEAEKLLHKSLDMGINFIDTARVYTDSEEKIGKALSGVKDQCFTATKTYSRTYKDALKDIEISLKKLNTNVIDIYQLHNVSTDKILQTALNMETGAIRALIEGRQKGMIKYIGISSHKKHIIETAIKNFQFDTIQIPLNIIENNVIDLINKCKFSNIGTIAMKPLAGGAITNGRLALKYVLSTQINTVIPGMQKLEEVEENCQIKGELDNNDKIEMEKIIKELNNNFCRRCEYCIPYCQKNINITLIFLLEGYYSRYGLKEWAKERYSTQKINSSDCIKCGKCEKNCPYELPIIDMLEKAHNILK